MKKAIGIMIVIVVLLAGCNQVGSVFQPIIGSWETTILGVTVAATFHANGSATETNSLGQVGTTRNGTWSSSDDVLTLTWDDESVDGYTYSFNADHSEMTLAPQPSGLAITYSRQ